MPLVMRVAAELRAGGETPAAHFGLLMKPASSHAR